ncbi:MULTISPECIES: DegT/DnrJ/EryC1/StrS family aminotransferase [unclassified Marinobacter]|mgnify:FL=1|uniref:DegT/DnrJ/EryC1/StrS family aminotransferase n=1 Tax=unclassified Marinobacter TaxID=83889 RepID=UPI00257E548C|nr:MULTISPECIES: DegT/DnrJ/EryC1/StrS family aminotransferase [unclassified Marinobacter]
MFAKLRPVGSPVPKPQVVDDLLMPWDEHYTALYSGSGTEALSLGVKAAIAMKAGSDTPEVIIPAYGCPDLVAAIVAQDARPVLVDFAPDEPVMDEEGIRQALTERTVAIIAVNFLGACERLKELSRICSDNDLVLIEDSAQRFPPSSCSHGLADFVVLSFGRGKPINLMGGGALLFRRTEQSVVQSACADCSVLEMRTNIGWHIKRLLFNALLSRYIYPLLERAPFLHVGETRFHPLEAIRVLELPSSLLAAGVRAYFAREPLHLVYDRELSFLREAGWAFAGTIDAQDPTPRLRYALLAPNENLRNQVVTEMNENGIGANIFYGRTLPEIMDAASIRVGGSGRYPNASNFAKRLITLPTHEGVGLSDISTIISVFERLASEHCND